MKIHEHVSQDRMVSIIDAGFGGGQQKLGVENGYRVIGDAGLRQCFIGTSHTLLHQVPSTDFNSLKPPNDPRCRGMHNPRWVSATTRAISNQVFDQARLGRQVLTIGGDHSIAIGTLTGTTRALRDRFGPEQRLGVIYIDAHADLNTPEDSISGNIHGMALAFASRLAISSEPDVFDWVTEEMAIDLAQLVYIGLRNVDESERQVIEKREIKAFWMKDVREKGIEEVIGQTLQHLDGLPIHISFDIDGLDPSHAPSTGLPEPDGLTLEEGEAIMRALLDTGQLVALDIVEINQQVGTVEDVKRTLNSAIKVIKAGFEHAKKESSTQS